MSSPKETFTNPLCFDQNWIDGCKQELLHVLTYRPDLAPNLHRSRILSVVGCRNRTYDDRNYEMIFELGTERYHAEFTSLNGRPQLLRLGTDENNMHNVYSN